jgi:hypothetical protein
MISIKDSTDYSKRVTNNLLTKLGRFSWFRSIRSKIRKSHPAYSVKFSNIFDKDINVNYCLEEINDTALSQGLYLHQNLVDEILNFAIENECIEPQTYRIFSILLFKNLPNSNYIYRGLVTNTHKCQAISEVKFNYRVIEIATKFLGYEPTNITQHLTWSLVIPESEQFIQQHYPATKWHYDVVGEESLTFNLYLTDVNNDLEGPHQFISGSHKNQPWQLLLKPNTIDESTLNKYFPQKPKLSVLGRAGYGFIENPLCLHRVKPPAIKPRLILQIRYS